MPNGKIFEVKQATVETMVLLVFLAIVWAAVGIYWLRTRLPGASVAAIGSIGRRLSSLDDPIRQGKRAPVVPLRAGVLPGTTSGVTPIRGGSVVGPPGHSLTAPARHPQQPAMSRQHHAAEHSRGVSSEQARIRRRNVLAVLVASAFFSLAGVFAVGGSNMIVLHLFTDALLLGFVLLLVQYQRAIELDRTRKLPVYATPPQFLSATGTDGRY